MEVKEGMKFQDMDKRGPTRVVIVKECKGVTIHLENEATGKVTKSNIGSFYPAGTKRSKGWVHLP